MIKKALLISNPGGEDNENYCAGVNIDMKNYKDYLMRPAGGGWYSHEIIHLDRPTISQLNSELTRLTSCDYVLTVFSGHGYYSAKHKETVVELKEGVDVQSTQLIIAPKQTIILDCCRVVALNVLLEKSLSEQFSLKRSMDLSNCRREYENQIMLSPKGTVIMYACDINETASDAVLKADIIAQVF